MSFCIKHRGLGCNIGIYVLLAIFIWFDGNNMAKKKMGVVVGGQD